MSSAALPEFFVPPADHPLRPHVVMVFRLRGRGVLPRSTILPMSTVDILFNLADPMKGRGAANGGAPIELTRTRIAGVQTGPMHSWLGPRQHLIGVNLRAERAAELLRMPLRDLTGASIDGSSVVPGIEAVRERLGGTPAFSAQCAILLDWLLRLRDDTDRRGAMVRWACRELRRSGDAGIRRVAADLGVSTRHLRRLFDDHVGVGPAAYLRLRRFADALRLLPRARTLTEVAHAARYFDQAHFSRDFKALAWMTPQDYARHRAATAGRIIGG